MICWHNDVIWSGNMISQLCTKYCDMFNNYRDVCNFVTHFTTYFMINFQLPTNHKQ